MSIYVVDSLLKSHNDSCTGLLPRNLTSKCIQLRGMSSMRERGALGARRRKHSLRWPCALVVMFMSFGIRKCQVQILTQTETSYVNLRKFCKNSETLSLRAPLRGWLLESKAKSSAATTGSCEQAVLGMEPGAAHLCLYQKLCPCTFTNQLCLA